MNIIVEDQARDLIQNKGESDVYIVVEMQTT